MVMMGEVPYDRILAEYLAQERSGGGGEAVPPLCSGDEINCAER